MTYIRMIAVTYVIYASALRGNELMTTQQAQVFRLAHNTQLIIEKGDITKSRAQAIVNAANPQLSGGGGVCGAIFQAAGWDALQAACDQFPEVNGTRCLAGEARMTDSFNLSQQGIRYIIHAVGPDCRVIHDEALQNILLESTYRNVVALAAQHKITSIAFPFISSAIYAFPKKRAAEIALKTLFSSAQENTSIQKIYCVLWSDEDFDLFCTTAQNLLKIDMMEGSACND